MLLGSEITSFLTNDTLQSKTNQRIKRCKQAHEDLPLVEQLTNFFKHKDCSGVSSNIGELKSILDGNGKSTIKNIGNEFLSHARKDNFFTYPAAGHTTYFGQRIVVATNEFYDLSFDIINQRLLSQYKAESKRNLEQRGVGFYGKHSFTYVVKSGGMTISHFSYPFERRVSDLDLTDLSCSKDYFQNVEDGDLIYCDPAQTIMFESSTENSILISIEMKSNTYPLSLMFSAKDYELRHQNPSSDHLSRIQVFCSLLKTMDCENAIPVMKNFLTHSEHYIRWHAMQQLLGIDALAVKEELINMAETDEHPQVRTAAQKTLAILADMEKKNAA